MTAAAVASPRSPATPIQRPGRDWVRALSALRRLLANKEDTSQVFEIMRALSGQSGAKGYLRLLQTPAGGRLAYERVELAQRLMDDAWLDSFAEGSVGAAYRDWVRAEGLSAEGLADESRKGLQQGQVDIAHPYAWFGRRIRDTHDIWHILTGYGRDALGELCLVAFSYSQTRSLGWAMIAWGGYLRAKGPARKAVRKAVREGFRRGREAAWLPGEDYERLLAEPIDSVRVRLGLAPASAYEAVPADLRNPKLA